MEYAALTPVQLGQILKTCRKLRGLTQKEAGGKVGIRQSEVSGMEADMSPSSVANLYKLLSALQLELVIRDASPIRAKGKTVEW